MYDIQFVAYRGSDWAQAIEIIDAETNQPYDLSEALVELRVNDRFDRPILEASTTDATVEFPEPHVMRWRFGKDQMRRWCDGKTYRVGCRVTTEGGTFPLFTGTLAFLDGEFA
jgi:hypothetical protein